MLDKAIDLAMRYGEIRQDSKAMIRLIYMECQRNLDLLSMLRLEKIKGNNLSPSARKLTGAINMTVLQYLFAAGDSNATLLREFSIIKAANENNGKSKNKNLLTLSKSLLTKSLNIAVLSEALSENYDDCVSLNLSIRLKNLQKDLKEMQKTLANHAAIKNVLS